MVRRENFSPTAGDFVDSTTGPRRLKKGTVPCLFTWNNSSLPAPRLNVWDRCPRPPTPELLLADMSEEEDIQPMEVTVTGHDYCVTPNTSMVVHELMRENENLRRKIEELQHQLEFLQLRSTFNIPPDPTRIFAFKQGLVISFYFRFASYKSFLAFWKLVEPAANSKFVRISSANAASANAASGITPHRAKKLLLIDELLLFLMYLSVGLPLRDLANSFFDSPDHHQQDYNIMDSLFVSTAGFHSPRGLFFVEIAYYLQSFGIAPHGPITFVSPLYAGSMSDKDIFKLSGITKCLSPEMAIMVDKGFLVDNLVVGKVYRPAFLVKNTQMAKEDVQRTQSIARLRVHVERCIRRIKENKLFEKVIPVHIWVY
ncbi:hypothetical protein N1851_003927 [Merluccius polli]|uniref:DDE Tnp4 domain-containing protein n=1 Tax=Merluccius polli TaxID=89951 RepID=A0AA47PB63_MERPO|nr:hypothetical protein N1851_003927 [Merluccius polli]